ARPPRPAGAAPTPGRAARGWPAGAGGGRRVRPVGRRGPPYHVTLEAADRPGVLSAITGEFARHGVSIAAARQTGEGDDNGSARIVIVTHRAPEAALAATVDVLAGLDVVHGVHSVLRVEDLGRKGVAG